MSVGEAALLPDGTGPIQGLKTSCVSKNAALSRFFEKGPRKTRGREGY